jgi:hypothetical protein
VKKVDMISRILKSVVREAIKGKMIILPLVQGSWVTFVQEVQKGHDFLFLDGDHPVCRRFKLKKPFN